MLEFDLDTEIYDSQLLLYINAGIRYLINNNIPLVFIDSETQVESFHEAGLQVGDEMIVISWLHLECMQKFDRTLMSENYRTTQLWIDSEKSNLINQLKVIYDTEVKQ